MATDLPNDAGSYRELAGSDRPDTTKGPYPETELPSRCGQHRRHHHSHTDGHEASTRRCGAPKPSSKERVNSPCTAQLVRLSSAVCCRHGRRHAHRRHEGGPNQAATPVVVATGMPAESSVIGYPDIYKAKDEEPGRRACPDQRRHRHGNNSTTKSPPSTCLSSVGTQLWSAYT